LLVFRVYMHTVMQASTSTLNQAMHVDLNLTSCN
jgi:hypothetical protein